MLMEKQRLREEIAKLTRAAKKQDELEDVSFDAAAVTSDRARSSNGRIATERSRSMEDV